jgi:hypothetical protein
MSRDTLANPPPPYVTFGDIFTNPPFPLKCHVLFEWPPIALVFNHFSVFSSYQLVVPHLLEPYFSFANCLSCLTLRRSLRRSRGRGCTSRATESAKRCRTATWQAALLRHLLENKKRNNINRNIGNKRYMLTETMFLWCFVLDITR